MFNGRGRSRRGQPEVVEDLLGGKGMVVESQLVDPPDERTDLLAVGDHDV